MKITASEVEVSTVELAALIGCFSSALRDMDYLRERGLSGPYGTPAALVAASRKVRANIDVLADELHQLTRDPAQLPLFPETNHATH